jgi:phage baseplate assembly protein W
MAFNPQIIPATDFYPNVGVGLGLPFSTPGVFQLTYSSAAALKNNMINYLLTEPGERWDNPTFGGGLRKYLFEQISNGNLESIQDDLSSRIAQTFPQVTLNKVEVIGDPVTQVVTANIYYSVNNQSITDQIEINFG